MRRRFQADEMNPCRIPHFLLYSPCANGFMDRMIEKLDASFSGFGLEVFRQLEDIMRRLRDPKQEITSAILIAPSQADLRSAEELQPMLEDIPVIFVLPDGDSDTVAIAHRFRPRFLTYLEDDEDSVVSVLRKLAWKNESFRWATEGRSSGSVAGKG